MWLHIGRTRNQGERRRPHHHLTCEMALCAASFFLFSFSSSFFRALATRSRRRRRRGRRRRGEPRVRVAIVGRRRRARRRCIIIPRHAPSRPYHTSRVALSHHQMHGAATTPRRATARACRVVVVAPLVLSPAIPEPPAPLVLSSAGAEPASVEGGAGAPAPLSTAKRGLQICVGA